MPQQSLVAVENSFINGLVTEATGLNFPEAACTETYDCEFNIDGSVSRRLGFDFENNHAFKIINRQNVAINSYLWPNVAGDGNTTLLAMQVGNVIYFYETTGSGSFSPGEIADSVTLTPVSGAPAISNVEAQFSDGNGFLFITHPYCDPIRVSYDSPSKTLSVTSIHIKVRDFLGSVADTLGVDERPTVTLVGLDVNHTYNLYNQGWTTTNLTAWDTAQPTMPSNADVMWRFKDASNNFDASTASITRPALGNTPAPKGHFIVELANQDRNAASGLSGISSTTTNFQRPSISAFFAGRVFYSGINLAGFNSNIYFSQIIERPEQYEQCYQENDPTSEDLFDELPSDGGVITILEAGTIYKMITVPGGLAVFAANGVWFITGSTGVGFTATDYAQLKIADINTISSSSFVNVAGFPCWWNSEGIYLMSGQGNLPKIDSLTYNKFKTFYDNIPLSSKRYARGFYNKTDAQIRWVYRSSSASDLTQTYEFDRVLNFNVRTQAFYPWTISNSPVKVHGIVSTELITKPVSFVNVVDNSSNPVVDSLGNQVVSFSEFGSDVTQFDKFIVSYAEAGSYVFTFADRNNDNYVDWYKYDHAGIDYESYLITGYKIRGQAMRKFQSNYINIYSRLEEPVSYDFQGIWDFANTGDDTGRWSSKQRITHDDLKYNNAQRRLKIRGHGKALQFKVSSVAGEPFDIIGWSSLQTVNSSP